VEAILIVSVVATAILFSIGLGFVAIVGFINIISKLITR